MEKEIESLEQQNIAFMSELFQQQLYDVNETKYEVCPTVFSVRPWSLLFTVA